MAIWRNCLHDLLTFALSFPRGMKSCRWALAAIQEKCVAIIVFVRSNFTPRVVVVRVECTHFRDSEARHSAGLCLQMHLRLCFCMGCARGETWRWKRCEAIE